MHSNDYPYARSYYFFSSIVPYASANISIPDSSVDSSVPLTVTLSLSGQSTLYFDGYTEVMNASTNNSIGNAYRYKSSSGSTVTMINGGSIGSWAVACKRLNIQDMSI